MRDQPKWEGKQACPECGRVTYSSDTRECLICGIEVGG